ncbi:PspC domain-containing protein, partial [bacterium]|nr:PspC domain-containing protein [bacterium]
MSDTEENKTSQNAAYRRLYRSNTQKVLAGVCGGV